MKTNNSMASPLKQAKGLGSAKTGLHHWWSQRLTALALIPLMLWFVSIIAFMGGSDYQSSYDAVSNPFNATLFLLLILASFWHAQLGLQVVLEDYISSKITRITLIVIMKFILTGTGVLAALSVLRIVL
mgnify:CR=1 FL=1|jgi:succinate dehydrogenase / fumarate reductase membrane anchor subunit